MCVEKRDLEFFKTFLPKLKNLGYHVVCNENNHWIFYPKEKFSDFKIF